MSGTEIQSKKRLSNETFMNLSMLSVLCIFFIAASLIVPTFFDASGLLNIVSQQSYLIIMGIGVTLLLITGHFDLSVGGVAACAGVLVAYFCQPHTPSASSPLSSGLGMAFLPAMVLSLAVCAVIGLINAYFIVKIRVASVIVTLGTMYMSRGLGMIVTRGAQRNVGLPEEFELLGDLTFGGVISFPVLIMIILIVVSLIVEKKTVFGRRLYFIGANRTAAEISGIKVNKQVAVLYVISAVLAGLTGIILASKFQSGRAYAAYGYEFNALVVTVLGGTSIAGGFGSVISLVIGAFILGILSTSLNQLGLPPDVQTIAKGAIIILAVVAQRFALFRRQKRI
jgi:ribose/xylose/arabinose/galactoside ABC-type transport system permease subunit